jgi:hypothetical protein
MYKADIPYILPIIAVMLNKSSGLLFIKQFLLSLAWHELLKSRENIGFNGTKESLINIQILTSIWDINKMST